ncbi:hypothetical protein GCM10007913_29990 [Devosia yakushimensis]|uniref:DUF805 domain-containing protein n=1 Tax=Devosia yakushimensis TaxID=470028 RepID=A0ABQ5UI24_9HYPH|nr:DUF805 domain-containing protein [Devosia yakushimensis]GLQ11067.1 hypothetical protein GCM10007913_29990 [Devosia yakushimensis]
MDFQALYTITTGRVSRKTWWIGILILGIAGIVLTLLLGLVGLGPTATSAGWGSLLVTLLLLYPSYCLSLKRRQDRANNGLDLKILLGLSLLSSVIQTLGIGITATDIGGGVMMPSPAPWLSVLLLALAAFGIYMLVQLGFLRGTIGPNQYGDDPVTNPATA